MSRFWKGNAYATERDRLVGRYNSARNDLMFIVVLTVVNIIFVLSGNDSYFFISAIIPYFCVSVGMYMCGKFPADYYTDRPEITFVDDAFLVGTIVIAAAFVLLYLLAFIFSNKKKVGWLIFGAVMFVADTCALLVLSDLSEITFELFLRAFIIFSMISGIRACFALKKEDAHAGTTLAWDDIGTQTQSGQEEDLGFAQNDSDTEDKNSETAAQSDTASLRTASYEGNIRVFLEAKKDDYHICYRRIKLVNELVINRCVYDESKGLIERPHELKAVINGHNIVAGFDGSSSYIRFDSELLNKKSRTVR